MTSCVHSNIASVTCCHQIRAAQFWLFTSPVSWEGLLLAAKKWRRFHARVAEATCFVWRPVAHGETFHIVGFDIVRGNVSQLAIFHVPTCRPVTFCAIPTDALTFFPRPFLLKVDVPSL